MKNLTSSVWWKAASFRALRTALVLLAPYIPTILYTADYAIVASVVFFGALTSLVTSLFGIAESEGKSVPWWYALLERSIKTAAQALLTLFGTATMFQDVDWSAAPQLVGTAVLGTLLIAIMGFLPETDDKRPLAVATVETIVVNEAGKSTEQEVPVVVAATADVEQPIVKGDSGSVG